MKKVLCDLKNCARKFKMYRFGRWIVCFLLLGHQIGGVNHDALDSTKNTELPTNAYGYEEGRILKFPHASSDDESNLHTYGSVQVTSLTRRIRSTLSGILCSPFDSCASRCGEPINLPYTCNCDPLCPFFSDCCVDYENRCTQQNNTELETHLTNIPRLNCDVLFQMYNLLVVNQCPKLHENIRNRKRCTTKMPKECNFPYDVNVTNVDDIFVRCNESVYRSCKMKIGSKCNEKIEPQCTVIIAKKCFEQASSVCRKCYTSYWPVYGTNGIIYKNSFCALCNSQENYTVLSPFNLKKLKEKPKVSSDNFDFLIRRCASTAIGSCPNQQRQSKMQDLCYKYLSPVSGTRNKRIIYKNVYCALCNGEKFEELKCVNTDILMLGLIRPMLETFLIGDGEGMKLDDIPAAFSILLNFGLDGRERMFFSSEGEEEMKRHQQRCGKGRIWDPFSEVCRTLYCSTEFVLVDYRCMKKETQVEEFPSRNETSLLPDSRAEFIHLTLSVEMEMLDILMFSGQEYETICDTIRKSLANSFNINIERIRNVKFNISVGEFGGLNETLLFIEHEMDEFHQISFNIDFDLHEDNDLTVPEPSVDSIVSMLASSLSMNGFELDIHNVSSRIFEIHQTVSFLTSWCNSSDVEEKKEYWNSEFSLIMDEDNPTLSRNQIRGVYVNKTGKFYPRGQFVADILFQGYQFSGNLINVSGVAVVCDLKKKLNESCPRILIEKHEYTLENGTLFLHNANLSNVDTSAYEEAENGSLWVCIFLKTNSRNEKNSTEMMVSYVLLWISVVAMAIVLVTYLAFGSLRNLPGCNTMNLTFSLMVMQITFLFGQRDSVTGTACKFVAHLLHYEILCCFMWMNVMAFDLYKTFGNRNILSNIRSKRKYLPRYMAYAYISPISIILTASLLDNFVPDSIFAPRYGLGNGCWIARQYSSVVFFAIPLAVIMCINLIFFILTIFAMRSVKNLLHLDSQKTNQRGRNDVFLYAKMALVIGLTWALSFAAAYVKEDELAGQILTYLFTVFNTLQGVFICWVFVCNRRVYDLYKEAFMNLLQRILNHAKHEGKTVTISRFANVMERTKSNDTVVSTLSNFSTSSNDSQLSAIPE